MNLIKMFEGIAAPRTPAVQEIKYVAFNVTALVDKNKLDKPLADFAVFLRDQNVLAATISNEEVSGQRAMRAAGAPEQLQGVLNTFDYVGSLLLPRKSLMLIHSDASAANMCAMHVNPKDPKFRKFLETRAYEQPQTSAP